MVKHYKTFMAIVWGIIFSFVAVEAALACDPAAEPCSVVFTLDEQNNLVLENVEEGHRTEGLLRLTTDQAAQAAQGPVSTSNILIAKDSNTDEFAETVARLSKIPGLHFLADPAAAQKAAATATGEAGKAMALSGAAKGENAMCAQMHLVMKATLEDAANGALASVAEYITAPEVKQACGDVAAAKMIQWYEGEQAKLHAHF